MGHVTMQKYPEIVIKPIHPKDMTIDDWIDDFNHFYKLIKENFCYLWLKERFTGYNWLDLKKKYFARIKNAKNVYQILETFWDAVTALQNAHTVIVRPSMFDSFFKQDHWAQKTPPFNAIFIPEVQEAMNYWRSSLEQIIKKRYGMNFEVLIFYDRGEYKIFDGYGSWKKTYGEGTTSVIAVNGKPIDEAVSECYETGILDWDFNRKKIFLWRITPIHFGQKANFTIKKSTGEEKRVIFDSGYEYTYDNPYKMIKTRFKTEMLPDKRIGYIRIKDFMDEHIDEDHDQLMEFYTHVEKYDCIIIDVRRNEGGSFNCWMKNVISPLGREKMVSKMYLAYRSGKYVNLFRKLSQSNINSIVSKEQFDNLPPEITEQDFTLYEYTQTVDPSQEIDFSGKIILLVDGITFSATDAFALFCKETKFAEIYGTPTGGDGISDSPIFYVLPNSKLVIRFTPAMGIDYSGSANEEVRVQPDKYVEWDYSNFDDVVDQVLKSL